MKKITKKREIIAVCVIVPIATALVFMPKIVNSYKVKKYASSILGA